MPAPSLPLFYLGTHIPSWLARFDVPLFVSRNRLANRRTLPRALGRWAMDSGGFTELNRYGYWSRDAKTYVREVRRFRDEIGRMDWAAPMDWMCEPAVRHKTGLTVEDHQKRTVANFVELRSLAPDFPFAPVLQGWELDDYLRCVDMYDAAGVDLTDYPAVGVGSVCRRQATDEIGAIIGALHGCGLRLHGFGVKLRGLAAYAGMLVSADSMAWSFDGRYSDPCFHNPPRVALNEANCAVFAMEWRTRMVTSCSLSGDGLPHRPRQ